MPTVNPSPLGGPKPQFELSDGTPATGNKLFWYVAGSVNTKQDTYTDSTGTVANANPVLLNTLGQPGTEIWLAQGLSYKAVYASASDTDPPSSPIWTIDGLRGINDATLTVDQWVASGLTPTFVSSTSFTLVGDQTSTFHVGRRIKTTNSGGTIYSTITVSAFAALTTVTVVNDSGVLDSGLSAVSYGLISAANTSIPGVTLSGGIWKFQNVVQLPMGGATSTANAIGTSHVDTTQVGNVGAGEDDLMTYSLPANSLSVNNKGIRVTAWGTAANNANGKTLTVYFGVSQLIFLLTASITSTWRVSLLIFRTGASTQDVYVGAKQTNSTSFAVIENESVTTAAQTDTAAITIKCTGTATANNDIVQHGMLVEYIG